VPPGSGDSNLGGAAPSRRHGSRVVPATLGQNQVDLVPVG
jgi:hypothetical protein